MRNIIADCFDWQSTEQSLADAGFSSKAINRLAADYLQQGSMVDSVRCLPSGRVVIGFYPEGDDTLVYDVFRGTSLRFCRFDQEVRTCVTANAVRYVH